MQTTTRCPRCAQLTAVVSTAAVNWFKCMRCSEVFSPEDKASVRQREQTLREMRARERMKGNR